MGTHYTYYEIAQFTLQALTSKLEKILAKQKRLINNVLFY